MLPQLMWHSRADEESWWLINFHAGYQQKYCAALKAVNNLAYKVEQLDCAGLS